MFTDTAVLLEAAVVASAAVSLAVAPRIVARGPGQAGRTARTVGPLAALVAVTALIFLNQVLFTVYVLRVHGGDPSFVARYLPDGWFALADGNPTLRRLAAVFPAPELLAPSVLRVQAFLELPFVLLAFATVLRWLDPGLYRRVARSPLMWCAAVSYTVVFCVVEWDLRNPYTTDDLVLRALSALVTPALIAATAGRAEERAVRLSAPGLLLFIASLGALGYLVLVVYDTALLYNLGRLPDRLPGAALAVGVLVAARQAAARLPEPAATGTAVAAVGHGLRWWLALFFVPALAVRYGVTFGAPLLAAGAGVLVAATASVLAVRQALAEAPRGLSATASALLVLRLGCALLAGLLAAYAAVRWATDTYYEAALLRALAAFLVTAIGLCAASDAWLRRGEAAQSG